LKDSTLKLKIVQDNLRPTIPDDTPEEFAKLIQECWSTNPEERPAFRSICSSLSNLLNIPDTEPEIKEEQRTPTSFSRYNNYLIESLIIIV
jgi:hypothetical protein